MAVTQAAITENPSQARFIINVDEMAQHGSQSIFRMRPVATNCNILGQMERKDRIILLLLDGKRTLQDVAQLIQREEVEVAYILVRLLKRGYIEFLGACTARGQR